MKDKMNKLLVFFSLIAIISIILLSLSINSMADNTSQTVASMKDIEFTDYSLNRALYILDNDKNALTNQESKLDLLNTLYFAAGDMYSYNNIPSEEVKNMSLQIPDLQQYYHETYNTQEISSQLKPKIRESLRLLHKYYPELKSKKYSFKLPKESNAIVLSSLDKCEQVLTKPIKASDVLGFKDYAVMFSVGVSTILVFALLYLVLSIAFQKTAQEPDRSILSETLFDDTNTDENYDKFKYIEPDKIYTQKKHPDRRRTTKVASIKHAQEREMKKQKIAKINEQNKNKKYYKEDNA